MNKPYNDKWTEKNYFRCKRCCILVVETCCPVCGRTKLQVWRDERGEK